MPYTIQVENIKCSGCTNRIQQKLTQLDGIEHVEIAIDSGTVLVTGSLEKRQQIIETLSQLGYPEKGSVAGLQAASAKAKSYVSCAVGRVLD